MFSSHQSWTFLWANHQITFASWNFKFFCGVWAITTLSTRNHHSKSVEFGSNFKLSDFSKSVRIRLKFHIFFNWWKDVVVFSKNILLRRVEFGIWLKHYDIFSSIEKYVEFEPNSHRFWKIWEFEIWAKFSQILKIPWEFGSNSSDFEWWVESGVMREFHLI